MAVSTMRKEYLVKAVTSPQYSVPANGYVTNFIDVTMVGYKPIGVIGIEKSGAGAGNVLVSNYYMSGNSLMLGLRNTQNSAATPTAVFTLLYIKN